MPSRVNAVIKERVDTVSATDVVSGMTKLSGSSPRLKVCVAMVNAKTEMTRKLKALEKRESLMMKTGSTATSVTCPTAGP
jgi:hypothetical protein